MPALPRLGVGLGYRTPIRQGILQHRNELDFLEVVSDGFFRNEKGLHALSTLFPIVPHSLNLSVGSAVDGPYLEKVRRIVDLVKPPWHSDHLAFTRTGDITVGHLSPVAYTEESLQTVVDNVRRVQAAIDVPFALENITMAFYWPNNTMEEGDFLREVVAKTGCYLLVDLENIRVNAANHGIKDHALLERLPLERVVQLHLAGGTHGDGLEHDTHSAPISEKTWSLLEHFCQLAKPPGVLIERDGNFPPFAELLEEVRRARSIVARAS